MRAPFRVYWAGDTPTPDERTLTAMARADPPLAVTVESIDGPQPAPRTVESARSDCLVLELEEGTVGTELDETAADVPIVVVVPEGGDLSAPLEAGVADVLRRETVRAEPALVARRLGSVIEADAVRPSTSLETDARNRYRALVEAVGDPMYVLDASGYCRLANGALARCTGYDREELRGIHASKIIGEENFDRATELINSLLETDGPGWDRIELQFESDDGTTRHWEVTVAALATDGDVNGSAGVVRDVSERVSRARELAQYETIVETAPIGLFVVDADGTIAWANDEFVDAFAESASEIVGMPFATLVERGYFEPEIAANYAEYVKKLLSSDVEVIPSDVRFHAPDGETRHYESYNALLPLEEGEYRGTVHAFRDVTEQRRYQRELERQNERLEQFASLVSHDLRNPLNVAQGHVGVLDDAVTHDSVSEIAWALDRMEALIEDLLALARQGRTVGDPEPVDLATITGEAWDVVDTGPATLDHDVGGTIRADAGRVSELFTNLFRNATEHAGEDVTVRVGRLDDAQENADHDGDGGFFVEDDGPGLPDGDVFDVGYTTAAEGTGFGLAIVAEIVDAHGWTVTAGESEAGGARFEIRGITFVPVD